MLSLQGSNSEVAAPTYGWDRFEGGIVNLAEETHLAQNDQSSHDPACMALVLALCFEPAVCRTMSTAKSILFLRQASCVVWDGMYK